jgi:hypothetical protein
MDHGEDIAGGPPGTPEEDGDRYIEIWNLVFMQYDRDTDGHLTPLPKPSVDTGMGLERIAAVLQGVHNNYEIDLFQKLLKVAADLAGTKDLTEGSLRVIADHIRSCAFMVVDGVMPSNEGIVRPAFIFLTLMSHSNCLVISLIAGLNILILKYYLHADYTRLKLAETLRLKSFASIRIYEKLMQYRHGTLIIADSKNLVAIFNSLY